MEDATKPQLSSVTLNPSSPVTTVKTSLPNHQEVNADSLKEALSKSKIDLITLILLSNLFFTSSIYNFSYNFIIEEFKQKLKLSLKKIPHRVGFLNAFFKKIVS